MTISAAAGCVLFLLYLEVTTLLTRYLRGAGLKEADELFVLNNWGYLIPVLVAFLFSRALKKLSLGWA
ncbi:MAG: hypothetical protein LBJ38_03615 [Oscillospiraceae bacterium]|nr:hypothetical protein [Oscillospiraceae bacterium]